MKISLRTMTKEDLPIFYSWQLDESSRFQAAFMPEEKPESFDEFSKKWEQRFDDSTINAYVITLDEKSVGMVGKYEQDELPEITYWIDRAFADQGITTEAVRLLIEKIKIRPIFASVAFDNIASKRVLEKNGFVSTDSLMSYASARQNEITECIYKLEK
ncbi:GNAT family N-acetyltransferase [Lactococcus protaetiae]|uniref:GNAT family N-acetyltransferase n=1 Tax=Lactococcus protaetiae TaxID=2592653 RepID=A0A514Z672_9LACT|nr:GNAT family N-acetyltransferase [Lactococcus protaetiae]QDK70101.1 GNAT family N-acetyltransferase [Lactococcus protaetiae]